MKMVRQSGDNARLARRRRFRLATSRQDHRRRSELPRPRRGNRPAAAEGADAVPQGDQRAVRAERRCRHPARLQRRRLGGRARRRHRHAGRLHRRARRARPRRRLQRSASISPSAISSSTAPARASRARAPTPSAPLGPWLATRDEIPDPQEARPASGRQRRRQAERLDTRHIFSVAALVVLISRFMSLQPGDVILTGTPAGVGLGQKPPS